MQRICSFLWPQNTVICWTEIVNYNITGAPSLLSSDVVYYSSGPFPGNEKGRFINKYLKYLQVTDCITIQNTLYEMKFLASTHGLTKQQRKRCIEITLKM
jgi:hypothetical protein